MKLQHPFAQRSLALAATLAVFGATAHALPNAKWDNPADDDKVLVTGVSYDDVVYENKKAPNGGSRADLTQGKADYLMTVFEWTFRLQMTGAERAEFTRRLAKIWMTGEYEDNAPGAFKVMEHRLAADTVDPTAFTDDWSRAGTRKEELLELRKFAATIDKDNAAWLLRIYDKYHPALAAGEPRLTNLTTNALTDRVVFMINEIIGKKAATVTPELRARIAKDTAALWPKLSPTRRKELIQLEENFYLERDKTWEYSTAWTKEEARVQWGAELQGAFPSVKPMYLKRKAALDAAKRKESAKWNKLTPVQQQMILMQMQQQFKMQDAMNQARSQYITESIARQKNAQTAAHVASMNAIESMKTTRDYVYSTK